ncbi:MAG: hypothetical protein PXY39_09425 [archaeon]|nr:hypothetical protein [archaeon]
MSSAEDPRKRKDIVNETGRDSKEFDPKDVQQIRKNIKSNEEERAASSSE